MSCIDKPQKSNPMCPETKIISHSGKMTENKTYMCEIYSILFYFRRIGRKLFTDVEYITKRGKQRKYGQHMFV